MPRQYVKDGKIVLNVSFSARRRCLKLGNDAVSFEARFSGVSHFAVQVPVRAILGIYARETGQGMIFPEGDADPGSDGRAAERAREAGVRNDRLQEAQAPGRQVDQRRERHP